MTTLTSSKLAKFQQIRDELIANYEAETLNGADPRIIAMYTDAINAMHDAIDEIERGEVFVGEDKGDWNDKSSRWHY